MKIKLVFIYSNYLINKYLTLNFSIFYKRYIFSKQIKNINPKTFFSRLN